MAGEIFTFNQTTGNPKLKTPITTSSGAASANEVPMTGADGRLHLTFMPTGLAPEQATVVTSEAIGAGKFVNFWLDTGVKKARLADSSNGRRADAFTTAAVASGASGTFFLTSNINTAMTGLTEHTNYFLSTAGGVSTTPPTPGAGVISQRIGKSLSATELMFDDNEVYELG